MWRSPCFSAMVFSFLLLVAPLRDPLFAPTIHPLSSIQLTPSTAGCQEACFRALQPPQEAAWRSGECIKRPLTYKLRCDILQSRLMQSQMEYRVDLAFSAAPTPDVLKLLAHDVR